MLCSIIIETTLFAEGKHHSKKTSFILIDKRGSFGGE